MSDSSRITDALVAKLRGDATLTALLPGGVWKYRGAANARQFAVVSLVVGHDLQMFDGRAFEEPLYLVKAVESSTVAVPTIAAAAARIDELLDHGSLIIAGYAFKAMYRVEPVEYLEVDDRDPAISWMHSGGRYQVSAAAITT